MMGVRGTRRRGRCREVFVDEAAQRTTSGEANSNNNFNKTQQDQQQQQQRNNKRLKERPDG